MACHRCDFIVLCLITSVSIENLQQEYIALHYPASNGDLCQKAKYTRSFRLSGLPGLLIYFSRYALTAWRKSLKDNHPEVHTVLKNQRGGLGWRSCITAGMLTKVCFAKHMRAQTTPKQLAIDTCHSQGAASTGPAWRDGGQNSVLDQLLLDATATPPNFCQHRPCTSSDACLLCPLEQALWLPSVWPQSFCLDHLSC